MCALHNCLFLFYCAVRKYTTLHLILDYHRTTVAIINALQHVSSDVIPELTRQPGPCGIDSIYQVHWGVSWPPTTALCSAEKFWCYIFTLCYITMITLLYLTVT